MRLACRLLTKKMAVHGGLIGDAEGSRKINMAFDEKAKNLALKKVLPQAWPSLTILALSHRR